jgi:hypothetical protein
MLLYALWAFGGWCGTPYPGWLFGPHPHPDPEPWWMVKVVSIIGGVAGGWMTQQIVGHSDAAGIATLTTIVGAIVTGGFLGGVVRLIVGSRGNVAGT